MIINPFIIAPYLKSLFLVLETTAEIVKNAAQQCYLLSDVHQSVAKVSLCLRLTESDVVIIDCLKVSKNPVQNDIRTNETFLIGRLPK